MRLGPDRPIALAGMMGVGKSTLGRALAERLGLPFCDLDQAVVAAAGRPIAQIFRDRGEAQFRTLEAQCLEDWLSQARGVLALGGGTLHQPGSAARLGAVARVLVLRRPLSHLLRVTQADPERPLVGDLERLYAERVPAEPKLGTVVELEDLSESAALARILSVLSIMNAPVSR